MTKKLNLALISIVASFLILSACAKQEESKSTSEPVAQTPAEPTKPDAMPQEQTSQEETKQEETAVANTTQENPAAAPTTPEQQQTANASQQSDNHEAALDLARKSGCLACHAIDKKIVGPPWRDVSKRYLNDPKAKDKLVAKVSKGGRGNWTEVVGPAAMPPYSPRVSDENISKLVEFVLSLEK